MSKDPNTASIYEGKYMDVVLSDLSYLTQNDFLQFRGIGRDLVVIQTM